MLGVSESSNPPRPTPPRPNCRGCGAQRRREARGAPAVAGAEVQPLGVPRGGGFGPPRDEPRAGEKGRLWEP